MFVSEESLFTKPTIKLRISNMEGVDLVLEVDPESTVDKLKLDIISHMFGKSDNMKTSLYHRLVHVETGQGLEESRTLASCGLKDQDEILVLKKRNAPPALDSAAAKKEEVKNTPNLDMITKATQEVTVKNSDRKTLEPVTSVDFQAELRKILISLIDAAQKILCLNPEAAKIFEDAEKFIEEQISKEDKVDEEALVKLVDMGFPREKSSKALKLNKMSTMDAIQWMLENEFEPDNETSVAEIKPEKPESTKKQEASEENASEATNARKLAKESGPQKVVKMLESFKAYRRREFKPNQRSLKNLMEMGFDERDSVDALRINNNREEDACEWLLGGNNKDIKEEDFNEGLSPESPVYKAIMANPVVQLGLNNPRSLIAFLHMLENPSSTQQWLNDSDTGPMLIQISRIYHAEKHAPATSEDAAK